MVETGRKLLKSAKSVEIVRKWWWLWLAEGGSGGGRQLKNDVGEEGLRMMSRLSLNNDMPLRDKWCMTRSSTKELLSPFENPKQKFRSRRSLFDTPSLVESNSSEFDHNFDIKEQSEEEKLAKRHEENSNIIKVIRASTDAAIRNQGASIKTLEIQIGQMTDFSEIRHIGCGPYAVSGTQQRSILSEIVPFPRRLQNFSRDDWREAQDVKILDAYDHTLPQKEKDPGSFTYLVLFIISILIKPL
ncbi:hypothetical protein Tco_0708639 [Tanacetum coccineum]